MHLHAGFTPPRPALEQLNAALASTRRVAEPVPLQPVPAKERWFDRRRKATGTSVVASWGLEPVPLDMMRVPIAGFGNVTPADAHRLVATLTSAAADWSQPTLVFSGVTAYDSPTDSSLWAKLDGDLDVLTAIARDVTRSVERLGFFVDRRAFQPIMELATTTPDADTGDLDAAVEALASFQGQPWAMDALTVFTTSFVGTQSVWREYERIPLAATR